MKLLRSGSAGSALYQNQFATLRLIKSALKLDERTKFYEL